MTEADLMAFGAACRELADAAEALLATLPDERREGASTVRSVSVRLAREAESGALDERERYGALPLSRPFGEWDYAGPEADAVWAGIGRVEDVWHDRLGRGAALGAPDPRRPT